MVWDVPGDYTMTKVRVLDYLRSFHVAQLTILSKQGPHRNFKYVLTCRYLP